MLNAKFHIKCITLFSIFIFTLLSVYNIRQTQSLTCVCNVCPNNATHCHVPTGPESFCYKSVETFSDDGDEKSFEPAFGCLTGEDSSLAHLQCFANLRRAIGHTRSTYISCCRNEDYCNQELPDPEVIGDPNEESGFKFSDILKIWVIALFILITILSCIVIRLVAISRFCSKGPIEAKGSIWTLSGEIDKFPHVGGSSTVSTHSYSVSDDLCQKIEDATSGLGEHELKQRTMARAVQSGKTDHVGDGRFGRVFRGQYHGEDVAVKAFRSLDSDSWKREDTILKTLNHENIVRFIRSELIVDSNDSETWMFLEYCPFGSLCDFLDKNEILGPQQAIKILFSIINGLNYLHEDYDQASRLYKPSIAHRDIKSKNILMKTPETCCIADFGHALVKLDEETLDYGKYPHLQVGTIRYMAPEILRPNFNLNYRHFFTFAQADLYQYGLILWEVCHRTALDVLHPAEEHKLPYDGVVPHNPDIQDMIKIVCDDQYRPPRYDKWDKYPMMKRLADLMVECWRPKPTARMETLGVKKKLKEMHEQILPTYRQYF